MALDDKMLLDLMFLAKQIADKQQQVENKTSLTADDVIAVFDKLIEKVKAAQSA